MKRTIFIVVFSVLLLALVLAPSGVSQMGNPTLGQTAPAQSSAQNQPAQNQPMGSMAQAASAGDLEMEIHLLRALDMAGLSKDQLSKLQALVANIKGARDALHQAHQQLRDFLVGFQGTPEEFEKAVALYDQKVEEAEKALHNALMTAVKQVKGMLTISQGEALLKALRPMHHRMMESDAEQMAPAPMMQQMHEKMQAMMQGMPDMKMKMMAMGRIRELIGRMREMFEGGFAIGQMEWGHMLLEHLDLIDRVLTERLAKMKG